MANYKADLIEKIDEIFGFNLSNSVDNVDYNFGQYKLNQLYKPLVKHFVSEFSKFLDGNDSNDSNQIISLFVDFFKLYFFQGDFGYFKSKYSSFNYKIPYGMDYSGKDTEFWRASKDCYYVKTSDVVNDMDIQVPTADLGVKNIRLQFFKRIKYDEEGKVTPLDVAIETIEDKENEELLGYNIYIFNFDQDKAGRAAKEKIISDKIQDFGIQITPGLKNTISEFLSKRGRDFFIHKKLKDFLRGELERYLFQVLKGDTQGRIDILSVENKIAELKEKHKGDNEYIEYQIAKIYEEENKKNNTNPTVYQNAYTWIYNFINILADFEEFKAKLWNKKRKVIKQEYCISLGKIDEYETLNPAKNEVFGEILDNEKQLKAWEDELKTEKYLDKISMNTIKSELSSGIINFTRNLVVDTDFFRKDSKLYETLSSRGSKKLYEDGEKLDGIMIKSENYQGLKALVDDYREKIQGTYIDPPFNLGDNGDFLYKTDYLDGSRCSMLDDRYQACKNLMAPNASITTRCDYNGTALVRDLLDELFGSENFVNEIQVNRSKIAREGESLKKLAQSCDSVFYYRNSINDFVFNATYRTRGKDPKWNGMHSPGEYKSKIERVVLGKLLYPPKGRHRSFRQEKVDRFTEEGRIRINEEKTYIDVNGNEVVGMPEYLEADMQPCDSNRSDIPGYSNTTGFHTENSEFLMKRVIETISNERDVFLDYFAGSASTQAVAQKLGRKWIGIELGGQFEEYDLPRLRSVLEGKQSGISAEKDVDYEGGGFFTYLYLNQYEDRFSVDGYLTKLEDEIVELRDLDIDESTKISQILSPLNELKNRIYNIDDELSNDELQSMSRMIHE